MRYGLIHAIGAIAQSVEQRIENPCVPSSILGPATIFKIPQTNVWGIFLCLEIFPYVILQDILKKLRA